MENKKCVIMYVDQALSFGGSLVVLGDLATGINKNKYKPIVVTEVPHELIDIYLGNNITKLRINHVFNYQDREYLKKRIYDNAWIKGPLKKALIMLITAIDLALNLTYIFRLIKVIRQHSVDIVHINNGFGNTEAIVACKLAGVKALIHFHGFGRIGRISLKLMPSISQFVAISKFIKNEVVKEGVPEASCEVIYNPVIASHIDKELINREKIKYKLNDNSLTFGIIGRVIPWKGQLEFVKAAVRVLKQTPNSIALIIGDKSDGSEDYFYRVKKLVKDEGMDSRFIFTGYIAEIHPMYELLDVLVHASIEPEPFGLVITEAMSHGLPVVISDLGATCELVRDNIDGYIVNPFDDALMAEKITQLLTDHSLRLKMGASGRKRAFSKFGNVQFVEKFEALYDRQM